MNSEQKAQITRWALTAPSTCANHIEEYIEPELSAQVRKDAFRDFVRTLLDVLPIDDVDVPTLLNHIAAEERRVWTRLESSGGKDLLHGHMAKMDDPYRGTSHPEFPVTQHVPETSSTDRTHVLDDTCWCGPTINKEGVWHKQQQGESHGLQ